MGVPIDHDGLVVDALPGRVRAVYVTPSHQYPLGVTMSLPRRRALLASAERNDASIIEDDYDSEFRFWDRPLEPLQTLDTRGRVIFVGVFAQTGKRLALLIGKRALSYFLSTKITQVARRFVRCRPMSMQSLRRCELC
jgi:DNA-binding transcriptional MocR family regulator